MSVIPSPITPHMGYEESLYRGPALAQLRILKQHMALTGLTMGRRGPIEIAPGVTCIAKINFNREEVEVFIESSDDGQTATTCLFATTPGNLEAFPLDYDTRTADRGLISLTGKSGTIPLEVVYTHGSAQTGNLYWINAQATTALSWWGNPGVCLSLDNTIPFGNLQHEDPHNNPDALLASYLTALRPAVYRDGVVAYNTSTVRCTRVDGGTTIIGEMPDLVLGAGVFDGKTVAVCRRRKNGASLFELVVRMKGYAGNIFPETDDALIETGNDVVDYEVIAKVAGTRYRNPFWFTPDGSQAIGHEIGVTYVISLSKGADGKYSATIATSRNTVVTNSVNADVTASEYSSPSPPSWDCYFMGVPAHCPGDRPTQRIGNESIYDELKRWVIESRYSHATTVSGSPLVNTIGSAMVNGNVAGVSVNVALNTLKSAVSTVNRKPYIQIPLIDDRALSLFTGGVYPLVNGSAVSALHCDNNSSIMWQVSGAQYQQDPDDKHRIVLERVCGPVTITAALAGHADISATIDGGNGYQPMTNIHSSSAKVSVGTQFYPNGGSEPYSFAMSGGGISTSGVVTSLNSCSGRNTIYSVTVTVTDACGNTISQDFAVAGGHWVEVGRETVLAQIPYCIEGDHWSSTTYNGECVSLIIYRNGYPAEYYYSSASWEASFTGISFTAEHTMSGNGNVCDSNCAARSLYDPCGGAGYVSASTGECNGRNDKLLTNYIGRMSYEWRCY